MVAGTTGKPSDPPTPPAEAVGFVMLLRWLGFADCCNSQVERTCVIHQGCPDSGTATYVDARPLIPGPALAGGHDREACPTTRLPVVCAGEFTDGGSIHSPVRSSCDAGRDALSELCIGEIQDTQLVQGALSTFVRSMRAGVILEVLLDDGSTLAPEATLNADLTLLTLSVNQAEGHIPLKEIECIASLVDLEQKGLLEFMQPHLDAHCCTLILESSEFVTFRFDNERHREFFAACLTLLVPRLAKGRTRGRAPPAAAHGGGSGSGKGGFHRGMMAEGERHGRGANGANDGWGEQQQQWRRRRTADGDEDVPLPSNHPPSRCFACSTTPLPL